VPWPSNTENAIMSARSRKFKQFLNESWFVLRVSPIRPGLLIENRSFDELRSLGNCFIAPSVIRNLGLSCKESGFDFPACANVIFFLKI
jgi:hypothetical protein